MNALEERSIYISIKREIIFFTYLPILSSVGCVRIVSLFAFFIKSLHCQQKEREKKSE